MRDPTDMVPTELAYESKFQWLTRLGFFARGLLYIVVGLLVIGTGRTEDLTGALEYVGRGIGRWMLVVIAVGTAAYGLWRLADAALGIEHGGSDAKAYWKRGAAGIIAGIYLYLAWKAVRILTAGERAGSTQQQADTVLDLPGGQLVLGLAALVLAIAGGSQLVTAFKCGFLAKLREAAQTPAIKWLGRIGYAARGIIFLLVGLLIFRAAVDGKSDEAGGMEQALDLLSGPLAVVVAGGLILFGAFSIVEALYRRIHRPPPASQIPREIERKIRE